MNKVKLRHSENVHVLFFSAWCYANFTSFQSESFSMVYGKTLKMFFELFLIFRETQIIAERIL